MTEHIFTPGEFTFSWPQPIWDAGKMSAPGVMVDSEGEAHTMCATQMTNNLKPHIVRKQDSTASFPDNGEVRAMGSLGECLPQLCFIVRQRHPAIPPGAEQTLIKEAQVFCKDYATAGMTLVPVASVPEHAYKSLPFVGVIAVAPQGLLTVDIKSWENWNAFGACGYENLGFGTWSSKQKRPQKAIAGHGPTGYRGQALNSLGSNVPGLCV